MDFLARKIAPQKWTPGPGEGEIPADAVTADLRTSDNDLSMWECSGHADPLTLEAVALALASGSDRVDKVQIVWISKEDLQTVGVTMEPTKGATPVESLSKRHVDLRGLDYVRLGSVAKLVAQAVAKKQVHLFRQPQVIKLLADAVKQNALSAGQLKLKVREDVEASLAKT